MSVCNVSPTIPILDKLIEDPVINCTFSKAISKIVEKLSWLIENPLQLKSISKNARTFIEEHHDYKNIANKYLKTWKTK